MAQWQEEARTLPPNTIQELYEIECDILKQLRSDGHCSTKESINIAKF